MIRGQRCIGVEAISGGERRHLYAREVILAAGGIHSPVTLLKSGVGPEASLAAVGIRVVQALPGVGQNLQNHPVVYLAAHVKSSARQSPLIRTHFLTALRFSSGMSDTPASDMMMLALNKSSWHGLGQAVAGLGVSIYAPFSRGTVGVRRVNSELSADVRFQMLDDPRDRNRLVDGLALAAALIQDEGVRELRNEAFAAGYSRSVRRLNQPGLANTVIAQLLARLLDGPDALRHALIKYGIARGDVNEARLTDRAWLEQTVQKFGFGMYHPAGTCRMGAAEDSTAVVDPNCQVRGLEALRVIDASVMPTIPRGNTNLPTIMMAEHAARRLLNTKSSAREWSSQ